MANLRDLAELPEVKSAVLSSESGAFLESVGEEPDGENVAAQMGFLTSAMAQAGDRAGLGALSRIAFSGQRGACLVVAQGDAVLTAFVAPPAALPMVEAVLGASRR
ncbi:MAG TPA: roadblock/LC7 domain-containing protein [Anaeromyxobacteraceae bacterium]|nr:roadblock/LC7 domain-containing protein [Anaeromyxobacteraceae bacterium]